SDGTNTTGGLFPIARFGKGFNYAGPLYWNKDEMGRVKHSGLFPVVGLNQGLSWAGPAWWTKDASGSLRAGGLFPLFDLTPHFSHAALFYWYKNDKGKAKLSGLFPIANFSPVFNHVGPVFWFKDDHGEVEHKGVFPIAYDGPDFGLVGPAWWSKDAQGDIDAGGLFPIAKFTSRFNYFGPAYWTRDEQGNTKQGGLFPIAHYSSGLNFTGPLWWKRDEVGKLKAGGLFPIANFSPGFNNAGPVFWARGEDRTLQYLIAPPLVGYSKRTDGSRLLVTPLGGRKWNADGRTTFMNVLGPLYQHNIAGDGTFTAITPFFTKMDNPRSSRWDLWPLVGQRVKKDGDGNPTWFETRGLGGLIKREGFNQTETFRMWPLLSYRSEKGGSESLTDWTSVFSYKEFEDGSSFHVLNPLVFDYERRQGDRSWDALLGAVDYEQQGDDSEFSLLYYLYRQKTVGKRTDRDMFPFITWDTGEEYSRFSFLWRLFERRRSGDKVSGHVLFIPWGDA
ncbi:MAG: hypothetical protein ACI82F_003900, partial [Planctomycetota bacterium]